MFPRSCVCLTGQARRGSGEDELPAIKRIGLWRGALAAAVAGLAGLPATAARADPHALELAIEATYLYRLAHFVTWPAGAFAGPMSPVVICIQGADPFGPILDHLVADKKVDGRPIAGRRLARLEAGSGCQIAYLAGGPAQSAGQALQALDSAPVVTVTDAARGPGPRGVFHLAQEGARLRFSIDAAQAEDAGVAISSKLLKLAVEVRR